MIKRKDEHRTDVVPNFFGGQGEASFTRLIEKPEELNGKGRVFSVVTLNKGCEIGYHVHKGDCEYYHVLSGECEYSDNGSIVTLRAGDTSFTPDGEGHGVTNLKDEPLVMVALVIYS